MKSVFLCAVLAACATEDPSLAPTVEAEAPPPPLGGPAGQWQWFDIPGATCGYGQQTGIGVSVGTGSEILIYLEGGGLCWDEPSCAAALPPIPPLVDRTIVLASYFTSGFTRETFERILANGGYASGIFDRTLANNPYRTATQIYVPYCTGDVHSGSTKRYFPNVKKLAHWTGRQNLERALAAVVASFPSATRVTLAGTSAGAYGATLNFPLVQETFTPARVDLVADSGPFLPFSPFLQQGYPQWNTDAIVAAEALGDYPALYAHYAATYPASRFAFVGHDQDLVIAAGHLQLPYPQFYFAMKAFARDTLGPLANWRSFLSAGTAHGALYGILEPSIQKVRHCILKLGGRCLLYDPFHETEVSRTVLADWLTQMHDDDPAWASQTSINQ